MTKSTMSPATSRRFSLLDGMILVAALAVGLGVFRACVSDPSWMESLRGGLVGKPISWELTRNLARYAVEFATPPAFSVSLATLGLRLRRPRPRWRRLVRQPGLVAALAVVAAWLIGGAFSASRVLYFSAQIGSLDGIPLAQKPAYWLLIFSHYGPMLAGFAVAIAWGTQLLVGRWRPEPSWLDRLGRLVGVGWLLLGAVAVFSLAMSMI